ncbi:MAG: hypothetical protein ACYSU1_06590, partial [Planctomycetota bacterium]
WFGRRLPTLEQQMKAAHGLGFQGLAFFKGGVEVSQGMLLPDQVGQSSQVGAFQLAALDQVSSEDTPSWSQTSVPTLLQVLKSMGCSQLVIPCGLDPRSTVRERAAKLENRVQAGERVAATEEALEEVLVLLQQTQEAQLEKLAGFLFDLRRAAPGLAIALQPESSAAGLLDPTRFRQLLAEISDLGVGYWHDTGIAEIRGMGGLEEPGAWLDGFANIIQGSTLHDFVGGATLQPPGLGQVEWELLREYLPRSAKRILALAPSYPGEVLAEARAALQTRLSA